jgi:hypothetical protein
VCSYDNSQEFLIVMSNGFLQLTSEGVEQTFATHLLLGTYLLTELAIPLLQNSSDPRVVVVSSGGMYNTKFPDWDLATAKRGNFNGQLAYAFAKRGQVRTGFSFVFSTIYFLAYPFDSKSRVYFALFYCITFTFLHGMLIDARNNMQIQLNIGPAV